MTEIFRARFVVLLAVLIPGASYAAQVRGSVDASPPPEPQLSLGYTRTRVATQAQKSATRADAAVFLAAKESGVIPQPAEPYKVSIAALELKPNIAACVIDGKVSFTNEERAAVTLEIEDQPAGTIAPGQSVVYECKTAEPKLRRVRIKEWPHIRGGLYVGEVGVVASVNANGTFSMTAPQGKYEVHVITQNGPMMSKPVEVKAGDVDVGRLVARDANAGASPADAAPVAERTIEPAKDPVAPAVKKEPVPAVKKEPGFATPILPTKDKLTPAKKKEPSARPSQESEELDFGE